MGVRAAWAPQADLGSLLPLVAYKAARGAVVVCAVTRFPLNSPQPCHRILTLAALVAKSRHNHRVELGTHCYAQREWVRCSA